jgi:hypothetical protein
MQLVDLNAGLHITPAPQDWNPEKHFIEYRFGPATIPIVEIDQAPRAHGGRISRAALEALVVETYRQHSMSIEQVRRVLGFETRLQVDEFLKGHDVFDYTYEDLELDRNTLSAVLETDKPSS